jgi:hypothetical protein
MTFGEPNKGEPNVPLGFRRPRQNPKSEGIQPERGPRSIATKHKHVVKRRELDFSTVQASHGRRAAISFYFISISFFPKKLYRHRRIHFFFSKSVFLSYIQEIFPLPFITILSSSPLPSVLSANTAAGATINCLLFYHDNLNLFLLPP